MNAAKKKEIGDPLAQTILTHKIGGKQPSSTPATPPADDLASQTSSMPNIQPSSMPTRQVSSNAANQVSREPDSQQVGVLKVQQPKTPDTHKLRGPKRRVQKTFYFPPDLAQWISLRALIEGREISDIATDLFQTYRDACEHQEKKEGKS